MPEHANHEAEKATRITERSTLIIQDEPRGSVCWQHFRDEAHPGSEGSTPGSTESIDRGAEDTSAVGRRLPDGVVDGIVTHGS